MEILGTDGELTWGPDADLTELGLKQAAENHQCWKQQLLEGAPYPKRFYVSPLQRLIKTHNITWPNTKPIVLENLRETIGLHLCHKRSNKSSLKEKFPTLCLKMGSLKKIYCLISISQEKSIYMSSSCE